MKATEFCYWLQGFFELRHSAMLGESKALNTEQVETIERHLNMVFLHDIDKSYPAEEQSKLSAIHNGKSPILRC